MLGSLTIAYTFELKPDFLLTTTVSAVGAFLAAWTGAKIGFRRTIHERALDRRVVWHEEAIQVLAQYEEKLQRLRAVALHELVITKSDTVVANPSAKHATEPANDIRAPRDLWAEIRDTEARARAVLRLADVYTDLETAVLCDVGLGETVNLANGHWYDVGPEPMIPWAQLASRTLATQTLRQKIQMSLRLRLELDGVMFSWLGKRYRRCYTLRAIRNLKIARSRAAS